MTSNQIIGITALAIVIFSFLAWNERMEGPRFKGAQNYEKCVQEKYGKHPSWFTANGMELPECK